jgi:ribose transport system substrate-binding protein
MQRSPANRPIGGPDPSKGQTGIDRALAILASFRDGNAPQRPEDIAVALGIPRSTTYEIIGRLVRQGYLQSQGRGKVCLGRRLVSLLISHQRQHREAPAKGSGDARTPPTFSRVPRTYLWNPELTELVDCRSFRRRPPYTIAFSNASLSNPWRVALFHSMEHYAEQHPDLVGRFLVMNAEDDAERQSRQIGELLEKRPDALLVSCSQAAALDAAVARAAITGTPIVVVDRRPTTSNFVSHVSASDIAIGRITAQWMVEKLAGKGRLALLGGLQGSSPAERRLAAAMEVFSQHPAMSVTTFGYTAWRAELGYELMRETLKSQPLLDGVWCDSGLQGAGSMQAFLDHGMNGTKIPPHTGGDVNLAYQLAARHDIPLAAVEYPAAMGARALQGAVEILEGRTMARRIEVHTSVVVSKGHETSSVQADVYVEDYVRWDRPPSFVISSGLDDDYDPEKFCASYRR